MAVQVGALLLLWLLQSRYTSLTGFVHSLDWAILVVYLAYVGIDGIRRTKRSTEIEGYLLANRSLPWWAVGLSVMATQLSADHDDRDDRARARRTGCGSSSSISDCRSPW